MRFRIEHQRKPTYGLSKPFCVQTTESWWPFGGWEYCTDFRWPYNYLEFDTLGEARDWVKAERARLAAERKAQKLDHKQTKPIYYRP